MHGKQMEVSHHPSEHDLAAGQRLFAIACHEEVPTLR